ncbi:echinoderm microtubule-associated protein-like 2 isoform X5 [Parasteatoda tepidariorum]|uniref:echinoderm microtubule-associated protein-like 2 isoform X5 n=1 Tax=Parasteatoda tepidariorum TaxID=114398 RepID=UPI001C72063F|nr:echinoderm microtubule-associated protein-like 2 isoform X4 [Parasteatoda tepidariorum]
MRIHFKDNGQASGSDGEDILNHDNDALRERVSDLEKKVQDQADEIVCLRGTLADVLRRVTQLEGRAVIITSNNVPAPVKPLSNNSHPYKPSNNYQRQITSPTTNCINSHVTPTTPQTPAHPGRRLSHYPSSGSLHSEGGHSSSSASPIPSPSPSVTNNCRSSPSPRHTPSPSRHISMSTSNLNSMKKWSSSQEYLTSNNNISTKDAVLMQDEGIVKLYLRGRPIALHIPTDYLQDYSLNKVNCPPSQRLKLEWVYGYRGRDCRSNLYFLPTGEMVYFIASVVVLYNVEDQIQRHYMGHTDDIKCLALHPNKLLIATGQVASTDKRERRPRISRRPHVRIWDSVSLNTLHVIGAGEFERAVCCVAFSHADGGALLCVIDESVEHTLSLWDWQKGEKGHKITETKSASETVLAAEFHPMDRHTLITIGKNHIYFWDTEGGTLAKKLGLFEKQDKPRYVLCISLTETGELLTGDSNGNILIWSRGSNRVTRTIYNAHDGGVFSICSMKDGTFLSGGGRDRRIVEWDHALSRTGREAKLPEQTGGVRALAQGKGSMLLVGTTKNCILQGTLSLNFSLIVQGHTEEIWALAVHPSQSQFISGGHDHFIHMWDTMSHSVVWSKDIGEAVQSACFSPDGSVLALATSSGRWSVLDATTRQVYSMHADGNEVIDCIRFSPDGRFLAVGSHDNYIYVYQVDDECKKYNRIGRCMGHSSFITHLDWSEDSTYIQTSSGDYELLYWNAGVCRQVSNMSIARDLKWQTQTCTIGFSVLGIWPENADGSDVNTCSRSHNQKLIATGDDFGKVNIYSFPACQPKSPHHSYGGHSSHVTNVDFTPDDTRLISLGGRDCSIMQWALT